MPKVIDADNVKLPAADVFGRRLKHHRRSSGLTQAQFAERTGTTAAYISQVERGQANPTLDVLTRLSEAVGVEVWNMLLPEDANGALAPE